MTPWEKFQAALKLIELNPEWKQKDLAAHLSKNPATISRMLSPSKNCIPEVLEALKQNQIGFKLCAELAQLPLDEQFALLQLRRGGATNEEVRLVANKPKATGKKAPPEKIAKVPIPLSAELTLSPGQKITVAGKVTVAGMPNQDIDLEDVENLLKVALSAVREAQKKNLSVRSAVSAWKDTAEARYSVAGNPPA